MRSIIKYMKFSILTLGLATLMLSCEVRETIVFEKDGSGVVTTGFFGHQMGEMVESFMGQDSTGLAKFSLQDMLDESSEDYESLSEEEKENLKELASSNLHIENQDGNLVISMDMHFDNVDEINDLIKQGRQSLNKKLKEDENSEETENDEIELADLLDLVFIWKNNQFERITKVNDQKKYEELTKKMGESSMDFDAGLTYVLTYTFPQEIKSIVPSTASLSKDKKTVTIKHSASKVMKDPKILDFKVQFKK